MGELEQLKKNLKILEGQAARYGMNPPLNILNDIEYHEKRIQDLEQREYYKNSSIPEVSSKSTLNKSLFYDITQKQGIRAIIILSILITISGSLAGIIWQYSSRQTWPQVQVIGLPTLHASSSQYTASQEIGYNCSSRMPLPGDYSKNGLRISQGTTITITFTIRNEGSRRAEIQNLVASVRGPHAWELGWKAPSEDFPRVSNVVIEPGQTYSYIKTRTFFKAGEYFIEPTLQNISGQWGGIGPSPRICFVVADNE